jgi:hypothetical protein
MHHARIDNLHFRIILLQYTKSYLKTMPGYTRIMYQLLPDTKNLVSDLIESYLFQSLRYMCDQHQRGAGMICLAAE